MNFTVDQFVPTKFDSAADKAKFANQFTRFLEGGYGWNDFPDWFYKRLSGCFGMIARYDRSGFFDEYFNGHPEDVVRFLSACSDHPCRGEPEYTYSDVEKALQVWLREGSWLAKAEDHLVRWNEQRERAELARLQARYGP